MNRILSIAFVILSLCLLTFSCSDPKAGKEKGRLFIIGGGSRPPELMERLLQEAKLVEGDNILILPFASSEPFESAAYVMKQFKDLGARDVNALFLNSDSLLSPEALDSVRNAGLIFITGGDQNVFMRIAEQTALTGAIQDAFVKGAMVAGTSAGAAVMSKKMITGNKLSSAVYSGNFRTIENNEIEVGQGLGLIENAIIDQHFIERMRMNRLISVCIENPEQVCIGIDESTALLVNGNQATVIGSSQVIVLTNYDRELLTKNGLLGAQDLHMKVILPDQTFLIRR
jgi:cyanophycinase